MYGKNIPAWVFLAGSIKFGHRGGAYPAAGLLHTGLLENRYRFRTPAGGGTQTPDNHRRSHMPTYVRTDKCDGCKGQDKTACMYICPHDLMLLDKDGSLTGHAM